MQLVIVLNDNSPMNFSPTPLWEMENALPRPTGVSFDKKQSMNRPVDKRRSRGKNRQNPGGNNVARRMSPDGTRTLC